MKGILSGIQELNMGKNINNFKRNGLFLAMFSATILVACGGGGDSGSDTQTGGSTGVVNVGFETNGNLNTGSGSGSGTSTNTGSGTTSNNTNTNTGSHSGHGSMTMLPFINNALIPEPSVGFSNERIYTTTQQPGPSDGTGAFRTVCEFSHMAYDDPLVYPGQPGRSHLHTFFGNTAVTGNSTAESVATTGNSTCRGGILNRSAYWVPAMIDTRTGAPIKPKDSGIYYKTGYGGVVPSSVQPFPVGLRMIAGDAKNDSPGGQYDSMPFGYSCHSVNGTYGSGRSIPNCNVGDEIWQHIYFPQCWDGVNLSAPDNKSHMSYPVNGRGCPASHPVPLPEITFNIVYTVTEANAPLNWRLSSDNYSSSLPGGYSAHGDWMNGWRPDIMESFVNNCDKPALDCGSHLLGGGRAIF